MTTKPTIRIRPAAQADLTAVRSLLVETWHDTYDALLGVERVTEITNSWHAIDNLRKQLDVPNTSFLVAEENDAIVGHAFANAQKPPALILSRLYVLPAHQRRGIGARLLTTAIAAHPATEIVRLEVEAENRNGLSFYSREGFREVSRSVTEGIDHLVMEKPIARAKLPG